jgi:ABC-2 type transport system permease protein
VSAAATSDLHSDAARQAGGPGRGALTGTRPLLLVSLRQDVRNIAPWVGLISVLSASSILAYKWIFTDPAQRRALATTLGANPALSLIFGPARDLSTADGFNAWRAGMLGALFAGLMASLIVIRNSRANEDSGQAELVASGVLARQSRLAVAVLMAALASLALGVVCFVITVACGGGVTSTLILSSTFAASGLMFAGVAAIAAQLGSEARTASSIAIGTLGVLYVLRGYIDSSGAPNWVTWLTPFGWLEETRPGTDNNPWPLLLCLAFAVLTVFAAFMLQGRRDFGQGMFATRPGPPGAGIAGNVWGLGFKLNRGSLISWLIAFAGLGLIFGTLASSIGDLVAKSPEMAKIIASGATDAAHLTFAFLVTILQIIAIIAAVMGVQIVLRVYAEEVDYRVEPLLAGSLRRRTYLASNAVIGLLGPGLALVVAGAGLGLVASAKDSRVSAANVVWQSLVTIPAMWTLVALALAAVGAAPKLRLVGWLGVVATFGLTILGPTFNLPSWALDISPLRHVPNVTAASPAWTGLVWLTGFIALFLATGFVGYRRRDIM